MRKNILLTIGSISAAALPVATVISCGVNEPTKDEIDNLFKLKSESAMRRVQEEYWWKVFQAEDANKAALTGTKNITNDAYDVAIVKDMVDFVLKKHLVANDQFLINLAGSHLQTKAMKDVAAPQTTHQLATTWGMIKYRTNGDLTGLSVEAKKFLLKHDKNIRKEVLKNSVAYLFLNKKITRDQYKEVFMGEDDKFTEIQKIMEVADFNLVNEAIKQHKFARWSVTMSNANSLKYLSPDEKKFTTLADADAAINDDTTGTTSWKADMKYSDRTKHAPAGLLPLTDYEKLLGYAGVTAKSGTRGKLKQDLAGLKLAINKESWNGYVTDDIISSDIPYFKKDTSIVSLERVFGLMPIFKSNHLTFTGSYFENAADRKMLAMELATSSSAYSEAEKYYSTRKTDTIKLEIISKDLKDMAIEHGFKFIKE